MAPAAAAASAASDKSSNPTYNVMIKTAIRELNEKGGSSRSAILKYVTTNYSVSSNANVLVKRALQTMIEKKELVHSKSTMSGANGSFKLAKSTSDAKKTTKTKDAKSAGSGSASSGDEAAVVDKAKKKTASTSKSPKKAAAAAKSRSKSKSPMKPRAKTATK